VVEGVSEEVVAVGVRAGDDLGHGAERGIDVAGVGEAIVEDLDVQLLSLVGSGENRARRRQA